MSKDIAVLRLREIGFYVTSIQREESQIQQAQKQTSPELKQNVATYVKENKPIQYRSNFAPQSEKNSDAESKTSTVVKLKRFEAVEQHRIKMIDCPACNCRISSQAKACPQCGQPIQSFLNNHQTDKNLSSDINDSNLNIGAGLGTIIMMAGIIVLMIVAYQAESQHWIAILCLVYLFIWGSYIVDAIKKNNIGKVILLIFLPFLGIIICGFLTPNEDQKLKDSEL